MRNVTVNSIGEYIREQREQARISMRQLAQAAQGAAAASETQEAAASAGLDSQGEPRQQDDASADSGQSSDQTVPPVR